MASPFALGVSRGLKNTVDTMLPIYMRLQERKQELALRQEEIQRQKAEQDMNRRMDLLRTAIVSKNPDFIKKTWRSVSEAFKTDGINFEDIEWDDKTEIEAAKSVDSLWGQYRSGKIQIEQLYEGVTGVLNELPRSSKWVGEERKKVAAEQWRLIDQNLKQGKEFRDSLRSGYQTEPQARQGLRQEGLSPLAGEPTSGELGQPLQIPGQPTLYPKQEEAEEPTTVQKTIYGPKGQTKSVAVRKGETYTPPTGWSLKAPSTAQNALREIDLIAKSVGVNPAKLRTNAVTEEESKKIIQEVYRLRKWNLLGMLLGMSGQSISPSGTQSPGELNEILRKE